MNVECGSFGGLQQSPVLTLKFGERPASFFYYPSKKSIHVVVDVQRHFLNLPHNPLFALAVGRAEVFSKECNRIIAVYWYLTKLRMRDGFI
eukprot:scaffold3604_cov275-Pinguiococcus_pyrenoidosus.AAC.2